MRVLCACARKSVHFRVDEGAERDEGDDVREHAVRLVDGNVARGGGVGVEGLAGKADHEDDLEGSESRSVVRGMGGRGGTVRVGRRAQDVGWI